MRMCTLVQPLQLFNSSFSRAFQVEATANKWLKVQVKYASFLSPPSGPLSPESPAALRVETGVSRGVKEERITQDTLQIKSVSSIICSDPSCDGAPLSGRCRR